MLSIFVFSISCFRFVFRTIWEWTIRRVKFKPIEQIFEHRFSETVQTEQIFEEQGKPMKKVRKTWLWICIFGFGMFGRFG